ncbi:MAG TPA: DUF3631 domain-containing protein [Candidatus Ozemobacteraceae bacterium]|nr:DUF3631 domain-containing protein [Candidatus Ozemobacteraceae bacterium]
MNSIRSDDHKITIERLQGFLAAGQKDIYDREKKERPGVTWSGTFDTRCNAGLLNHSGLIVIDLDKLGERLPAVRAALVADPAVAVLFVSPSGAGLKIVFAVDNAADHGWAWRAVADRVKDIAGVGADESGKDIPRLCYMSYDPDCYFNPDPVPVVIPAKPEPPKIERVKPATTTSGTRTEKYCRAALERACEAIRATAYAGGAHDTLLKESHAIGGLLHLGAYSFDEAHNAIIEAALPVGFPEGEAARVARDGLTVGQTKPRAIPDDAVDANKTIRDLAKLGSVEYEQQRQAAAAALNVRVSALDKMVEGTRKAADEAKKCSLFKEVDPWPEVVNGVDVLDELLSIFRRYVIADIETLHAGVLWAAFTWFIDHATVAPMFLITAPEKGCGKSVFLSAIGKVVRKPLPSSNISPAAVFRAIEKWGPTLLVDECDTFVRDNEPLRGLLNSGHIRDIAFVLRTEGEAFEPTRFSTWGCKALAGIGGMPETIMSRSIIATMRRKAAGERVESLRRADPEVFEGVTRRLARWAADAGVTFEKHRPLNDELTNRAADNWEPLYSVADIAGGEWPMLARAAARRLAGIENDAPSLNEELLQDIREVFEERQAVRLSTKDLLNALNADDMRPWGTHNRGLPMKPRQLAKRLEGFGIHPKMLRIGGSAPARGYDIQDFRDTFTRYLSNKGKISVTTIQPSAEACSGGFSNVTAAEGVTDKKAPEPASILDCNSVTDKTGVFGEEGVSAAEDGGCFV